MLQLNQENILTDNFTLTIGDGFNERRRMFRKSLGTIPFRKIGIDKANTTQMLTRRSSMVKSVKK